MVFDLLTLKDKQKILSYRDEYGSAYRSSEPGCDIETLLRPWNEAKSQYLESIFGDNLIVTRPVEFKESEDAVRDRMYEYLRDMRITTFVDTIQDIYYQRAKPIEDYESKEWQDKEFVGSLFSAWTLGRNKIDEDYYFGTGSTYELDINGTPYKVQRGAKPMRLIAKIANAYNVGLIPDEEGVTTLEYFRRKHSLGLNQKVLKGDLCLSIHPLDYMTMSDNEEGWESCMNWRYDGEYKQGTVEMMNSPCVVVGYLASTSRNLYWSDEEWNSKKWRSLFIVDKDFIINVRSYPYQNDNLVKAAIAELADMSGWGRVEAQRYEYIENYSEYRGPKKPVVINNREIALDFCTGAMYNDFGWGHYIALNPADSHNLINYSYCYSGASECVWCGTTDTDIVGYDYACDSLQCSNCNGSTKCQWCGERCFDNDVHTTADGVKMCLYCWDEHTITCDISNETYCSDNDDIMDIYLSTKRNEFSDSWAIEKTIHESVIGSRDWQRYFKIEKPREYEKVHKYSNWTETIYYVLVEDLTEQGLELYNLWDEDDIKNYLNEDIDN